MPSFVGHGVGDVVDVQVARGNSYHADQRVAHYFQLGGQDGGVPDALQDFLGGAHDVDAGVEIALFAHAHQTRPASCDQGARSRACKSGRGVHAAAPVRDDKVLVRAQLRGAVQDDRVSLGREAVLVRVARDGRHAPQAEVKGDGVEACLLEEGDQEGAEAAVHVQGYVFPGGDFGQGRNVVDDAVWEVGRAAYDEDCVGVDEARDAPGIDLVCGRGAGNELHFDFEVFTCLAEGCVCRVGEDPNIARVVLVRCFLSLSLSLARALPLLSVEPGGKYKYSQLTFQALLRPSRRKLFASRSDKPSGYSRCHHSSTHQRPTKAH